MSEKLVISDNYWLEVSLPLWAKLHGVEYDSLCGQRVYNLPQHEDVSHDSGHGTRIGGDGEKAKT